MIETFNLPLQLEAIANRTRRYVATLVAGVASFPLLFMRNQLSIINSEMLKTLPSKNVIFVANHQTYYYDGIALLHALYGRFNFSFLLPPLPIEIAFVAEQDTMLKKGMVAQFLSYAGAINISRHWVKKTGAAGARKDITKIQAALKRGWVIMFPQGTTSARAPGRKGVASIIKQLKSTTVPVKLSGFSQAFEQKGLGLKKSSTKLVLDFKDPLEISYETETAEDILEKIMVQIQG